jgi:hypothetical protein
MRYLKTYESYKNSEEETLDYILGLNESYQLNEGLVNRIKSAAIKGSLTKNIIIKLIKKGVLTTSLITTLLSSSPSFAKEYNSLSPSDKIEKVTTDKTSADIFDVSKSFESGVWKLGENGRKELTEQLTKVIENINQLNSGDKNNKFIITIHSSESKLRNRDAETKEVLGKGELAERRAKETKKFITEFFETYKLPNIIINIDTKIGGPENIGQSKEEFKPFQYVKIQLESCELSKDSFCGFSDTISNNDIVNNIGLEKEFDVTNQLGSCSIILSPGTIPDRIVIYGDDNIIGDSGFFATGKNPYTDSTWEYVPANVLALTKLKISNSTSIKNMNLEINHVNSMDELLILMLIDKNDVSKDFTKSKNDDDIANPIKELQSLFKSGVRDFVFYKKGQVKVLFDLGGKYKKIKMLVYSPRDKSDFKVKVYCSKNITGKIP